MSKGPLIGAIEAGGTKIVCAVGTGPDHILETSRIATTEPEETLENVCRFFMNARTRHGAVSAIGIGSFGPVDLDPASETFGFITTTPKPGWQHTELVGVLRRKFKVPVGFDTDVNAAALGEFLWGAGRGCDPLVYITVGTGVGGGVLVNGELLHGLLHPEIGHLHVPPPRRSEALNKECQCPFHKSCVEGYVCGPAIAKRWGVKAEALPPDHPAWEDVSDVLGHMLVNLILTLSPKRIVLGGGVMQQEHLLPLVRGRAERILNGYIQAPELGKKMSHYIVAPGLGGNSGILGALALGRAAYNETRKQQKA